MIELPEALVIARQMNEVLAGKRIAYGNRGEYVRILDSKTKGKPCPECGTPIEKIQYLGGACYLCPSCQT